MELAERRALKSKSSGGEGPQFNVDGRFSSKAQAEKLKKQRMFDGDGKPISE